MNRKKSFVVSGIFAILFIAHIVLLKIYDVDNIGPMETAVGFSHINGRIHDIFGINIIWYKITEIFGILALLVCAGFAFVGLMQLIRRKSLKEVDSIILKLGGLYAVVIFLYALFEKVIINYRPIIMPDATEPEASFPSSHTMLICVVMGSTILVIHNYVKNKKLVAVLQGLCVLIMVITVVGRLICGVHWFTDILGGIFISVALLAAFFGVMES
ncbi:phosphatase PAP2 family protein [Butyrivibrio sp. AE3004]|uniref:phosphatase PAP2 family protein n=1 Tax=Butyrivibrio sp. AE3004 TaxID=1506994 RepID=UPI00049411B0|nr:phosphatase PAP2 family protein [Butyrivibrio sp. AE3004]